MKKAVFILAATGLVLMVLKDVIDRESVLYTILNYAFYGDYIALIICCILPWKKKKELY